TTALPGTEPVALEPAAQSADDSDSSLAAPHCPAAVARARERGADRALAGGAGGFAGGEDVADAQRADGCGDRRLARLELQVEVVGAARAVTDLAQAAGAAGGAGRRIE